MPAQTQQEERFERFVVEDHPKGGIAVIDTMAPVIDKESGRPTGELQDEVVTRWFGSNPAAGTSNEDQAERLAKELNDRCDARGNLRAAIDRPGRPKRRRRRPAPDFDDDTAAS